MFMGLFMFVVKIHIVVTLKQHSTVESDMKYPG